MLMFPIISVKNTNYYVLRCCFSLHCTLQLFYKGYETHFLFCIRQLHRYRPIVGGKHHVR